MAKKEPQLPKRRRLLLTPSDEVWALVDEVHKLTGTPRAAIVAEILDDIAPAFQTTIEALRLLHSAPEEARARMKELGDVAVANLAQANLDLDAAMDARTVKGRRARRKRGAS